MNLNELTQAKYQKTAGDCTDAELYLVLLEETQRLAAARKPAAKTKKKL